MNDIREYLIKHRDEIEQKMLQSEKKTKYNEMTMSTIFIFVMLLISCVFSLSFHLKIKLLCEQLEGPINKWQCQTTQEAIIRNELRNILEKFK